MKLTFATAILAAVTGTTALQANELCGDNKNCQSACEDGRYHIVSNNGTAFFGCVLTTKTNEYKEMWCLESDAPSVDSAYNVDAYSSVCEAAAGTSANCHRICIIPKSEEDAYKKSCSESKGKAHVLVDKTFTYNEATEDVGKGC